MISELITSEIRDNQFYYAELFIGETGDLVNPTPGNELPHFGVIGFDVRDCEFIRAVIIGAGDFGNAFREFNLAPLLPTAGLECE